MFHHDRITILMASTLFAACVPGASETDPKSDGTEATPEEVEDQDPVEEQDTNDDGEADNDSDGVDEVTELSIQSITDGAVVINQFRATKYGVPYSSWMTGGWALGDVPAGSTGVEVEMDCGTPESDAAWAGFEVWASSTAAATYSGELVARTGDTEHERLAFHDAALTWLGSCDGGERSAVLTAGAIDDVDQGVQLFVEVAGLESFIMEAIEIDGITIDSLDAWNSMTWPNGGSLILHGLCATDLANEAYGWDDLMAWHRASDLRSMSIILVDGEGYEGGRLNLYDASAASLDSCTGYNQTATISAAVVEQG